MKPGQPIPVFVETAWDQRLAEILLAGYAVHIHNAYTGSGALVSARGVFYKDPDGLAVMPGNAGDVKPYELQEDRNASARVLGQVAQRTQYCIVIAVPNLLAWFYTDPRLKRELDAMAGPGVFYNDFVLRVV